MPSAPKWLFDVVERLSLKLPSMVVTSTEFLSPTVKRIRFNGDFSRLDFREGYYMDFRVSDTEVRRYTPSYIDIDSGILDLIVHLHADAAGARFMDNLKAGDIVNISAPRGHKYYYQSVAKYVIFGDETSLGLASSFFSSFRQNRQQFEFYFELDDDNKDVPRQLGLQNCTVFSKNGSFYDSEWIAGLPLLQSADWQDACFVLTGNVKSVQTFRKVLKGYTTAKVYAQGYWLKGKKGL